MSTTLVHVGVRASDLEATIRFWRDGLGLPVFSQQENCYDLSDGFHNFASSSITALPDPHM